MRLKNDARLRKRLFVDEAMSHPAKGHIGLWEAIIEKYTQPGDVLLDPMAGVGSTLIGALMGRDVVCVELEHHFLRTMTGYTCDGQISYKWERVEGQETGWFVDVEFGATQVRFDRIVDAWLYKKERDAMVGDVRRGPVFRMGYSAHRQRVVVAADCGRKEAHNAHRVQGSLGKMQVVGSMLGHQMGKVLILRGDARCLPLGSADSIVTSPPYAETQVSSGLNSGGSQFDERAWIAAGRPKVDLSNFAKKGYTRPTAIVTSPPYGHDSEHDQHLSSQMRKPPGTSKTLPYSPDATNIGNLRSQAYWDAMKGVYAECYRILRPQGIMVLVLKGFTRDGKYQDLPAQTRELVETLGFTMFDTFKRELWSLSFWRILQKRRDPKAFDNRLMFEEVLAFRKNGGEGGGVDAAITSPPYEGSLTGDSEAARSKKASKAPGMRPDVYSSPTNIAARGFFGGYTRPVDCVVSSPPFDGSVQEHSVGIADAWKGKQFGGPQSQARRGGYTRPGEQP